MKYKSLFFLFLSLFLYAFKVKEHDAKKANPKPKTDELTIISVLLSAKNEIVFNSQVGGHGYKLLTFKNKTDNDTIITRRINISKPTQLYYTIGKMVNGRPLQNSKGILLLPGDSVVLNNYEEIPKYSSGFRNYIDNIMIIPQSCYSTPNVFKAEQFDALLKTVDSVFKVNNSKIAVLDLNEFQKTTLNNYNYIIRCTQLAKIPLTKINGQQMVVMDSLYNEMQKNSMIINSINSIFSFNVNYNLINYSVFKKDRSVTDFWPSLALVGNEVKKESFYKETLLSTIISLFNSSNTFSQSKKMLSDKYVSLQKVNKTDDKALDTVQQLTKILVQTFTDFKSAKADIQKFNNGKYAYLLKNEVETNHEPRYLKALASVDLLDIKRTQTTLQQELLKDKSKLYVIDLWASWCLPCLDDYPFLKKIEESLKNKPIKFISISIDEEKDTQKWIQKMKDLGSYGKPNHFLLMNGKTSPMNRFFNIQTIPRYIVIDSSGKILEEDFIRPSDTTFKRRLEEYLEK